MKLKTTFLFIVILSFFSLTATVHAASFFFGADTTRYSIGDTFSVNVFVATTSDQPINAVSGKVSFPGDLLSVVSISKKSSIVNVWTIDPVQEGSSVHYEGIILNPGFNDTKGKIITITFKAKAAGTADLSFTSASILANDGLGTNVFKSSTPINVTILKPTEKPVVKPTPVPTPIPAPTVPLPAVNTIQLTSSTHPDQTKWYSNNTPSFEWMVPVGANGLSEIIDTIPTTIPPKTYQVLSSSYSTSVILPDGIAYFHIRFRNAKGWGPATHYAVQIDTTKPEFSIDPVTKIDPKNPVSQFLFTAKDFGSGIASYEVTVDNTYAIPWFDDGSHIFETKPLAAGKHTLIAKAIDVAGNITEATPVTFTIDPLEPPILTDIPPYLETGSYLIIKGKTYPNVNVDVYLNKAQQGNLFTAEPLIFKQADINQPVMMTVQSDASGVFTYVSHDKVSDGVYEIYTQAKNELGAQSTFSQTVRIPVNHGVLAKVGIVTINIFSVLIAVLAFIIILIYLLIHGHHKLVLLKDRLMKKREEI